MRQLDADDRNRVRLPSGIVLQMNRVDYADLTRLELADIDAVVAALCQRAQAIEDMIAWHHTDADFRAKCPSADWLPRTERSLKMTKRVLEFARIHAKTVRQRCREVAFMRTARAMLNPDQFAAIMDAITPAQQEAAE